MNRVVLAAILFFCLKETCGQQQTQPENLPEAPQPTSRSAGGSLGQGQRNNSRPGFPPVSPSTPGRMRVPPASRPDLFGAHSECLPDSSSLAETTMSCQPDIPVFARFLDSTAPAPLTPRQKFRLAVNNVKDPYNLLTIGGLSAISVASV